MDFSSDLYGLNSVYGLNNVYGLTNAYGFGTGTLSSLYGIAGMSTLPGALPYTYLNPETVYGDSFTQNLRNAFARRYGLSGIQGTGDAGRDSTAKYPGDVIIQTPPDFSGLQYDPSIAAKTKEDMTLDEYKQYFLHEMSQMPTSNYYRATFNGTLVIEEEAFKRMKQDPEYEQKIRNMLQEGFSVQGIYAGPAYGYQVIGDSEEKCHGFGVPVKNKTEEEETWWEKRHKRSEEFWQQQQERASEDKALTRAYNASRQSVDIAKIYAGWQRDMGFAPSQPLRTPSDTVAEVRQMISAAELFLTEVSGKAAEKK